MGCVTAFLASGRARKALSLLLAALPIVLFLLNFRRAGERTGRWQNALQHRREQVRSNAKCWTQQRAALLIVMLLLTGGAMGGSEVQAPCPPVVRYSAADEAHAAVEVEALPEGAVIVPMLGDYAVLRDQARTFR